MDVNYVKIQMAKLLRNKNVFKRERSYMTNNPKIRH